MSTIYESTGFRGQPNALKPAFEDMRDFAARSDFLEFYGSQSSVYAGQSEYMAEDLDAQGMLDWLAREFPSVAPYDHVKVLFSPLVDGYQSLAVLDDGTFRELQPHINFPYPGSLSERLSPQGAAAWRGLILFTEMNHGFINETAEPFAPRIEAAISDLPGWIEADRPAAGYGSPTSAFYEMVNWALAGLYYRDVLPDADIPVISQRLVRVMESRGFPRFEAFFDALIALDERAAPGQPVEALYTDLVLWLEAQPWLWSWSPLREDDSGRHIFGH